ncbi:hypothetical protein [Shewanella pealeana]|nr:hypothetical protein [Shewanella pealeana]
MFRFEVQPKQHSKSTLAIMLMLFVCQFFAVSSAYSVQYPNGEHPLGQSIYHHHSHEVVETFRHHSHAANAFNATESITPYLAVDSAVDGDNTFNTEPNQLTEHDHANHGHTPSDIPVETVFSSQFIHIKTISDNDIRYVGHRYAPPIPPPHT